jgi:hypothetical protein
MPNEFVPVLARKLRTVTEEAAKSANEGPVAGPLVSVLMLRGTRYCTSLMMLNIGM